MATGLISPEQATWMRADVGLPAALSVLLAAAPEEHWQGSPVIEALGSAPNSAPRAVLACS